MRAMLFEQIGHPLRAVEREVPTPSAGELLIRVHACGVCRTDLHLLDGEVEMERPPRVLGHQIIGTVEALGESAEGAIAPGDRVGVPWLGWVDGTCAWCRGGRENLCPNASAPRRTSSRRCATRRDARSTPSRARAISGRRPSPASSAPSGPGPRRSSRRSRSTRRSSSPRSARPAARAPGTGPHKRQHLPARASQRGARGPARRALHWRGRADSLSPRLTPRARPTARAPI